jgi:tRNA threonylcarbamoyladenosine biosynthesis protein TsaB
MKVLGLDTATLTGAVAVVDQAHTLGAARTSPHARGADLLVTIDQVFRAAELSARELGAVAVGVGPGSFTGLRIGMATGKGIAFAAGCPMWGVSSLRALAWELRGGDRPIVAALDARKGELYVARFDAQLQPLEPERVMTPDELWELVTGDAVEAALVGDALEVFPILAPLRDRWTAATPSGIAIAQLGLAGAHVDMLTGGVPSYLRPAEAEVKYPDGVPGALRTR